MRETLGRPISQMSKQGGPCHHAKAINRSDLGCTLDDALAHSFQAAVDMDDIEDLELTPSLLKFYRTQIHDLHRDQSTSILDRLKLVEMSAKERTTLERELLEYEDELDQAQQDLDDMRNSLVRERHAVIELVQENARLHGIHFI